jgi:hypothetical protein
LELLLLQSRLLELLLLLSRLVLRLLLVLLMLLVRLVAPSTPATPTTTPSAPPTLWDQDVPHWVQVDWVGLVVGLLLLHHLLRLDDLRHELGDCLG